MFRLEFEFAVLDGCSRVVVVVTERAKGRVEVEGGGERSGAIWEQTKSRGNCFYVLKFRTCASC